MPPSFTVSDVDVPAERRRRRLKAAALSVASVLVLIVGGGAAWYFTPPAMPNSLDEAQALVSSARFQRLSKEDKRPYMDVIREQFGSLDHNERQKMMEEDEAMRDAMRDARGAQMEEMAKRWLVMTPEERATMGSMWGNRGGGERRERLERPEGEQRPEPTDAERAERADRARTSIGDRFANGDAQANQAIGEWFRERRRQREAGGGGDNPRPDRSKPSLSAPPLSPAACGRRTIQLYEPTPTDGAGIPRKFASSPRPLLREKAFRVKLHPLQRGIPPRQHARLRPQPHDHLGPVVVAPRADFESLAVKRLPQNHEAVVPRGREGVG